MHGALVGALNNHNDVDVSNDNMTKINNRTPKGRAGTRPAPASVGEKRRSGGVDAISTYEVE